MSTLRSKEKGAPQFWESWVFTPGLQGEGERDLPCGHHPPLHGKGKWTPCLSFNASSFLLTHARKTLNWLWQLSLVWVLGLPRRVSGKESPVNAGDAGSVPELGRSLVKERASNSPGKSHGQRSLPDYSRWGREVKTTQPLSMHAHFWVSETTTGATSGLFFIRGKEAI